MIFNPVYGGASAPNLGSKTITENGTYLASSDNLDGYDEVIANVSPKIYTGENEDYVFETANELMFTLSGRAYYKTTADKAYAAYFYGGSYTCPILVSKVADGVKYTTLNNTFTYLGTLTYNGETYYYSKTEYAMGGNITSSAGRALKLSGTYSTIPSAAEALLDLALGGGAVKFTANGSYPVPAGYDGYGDIEVNVSPTLQSKTGIFITENGSFSFTPDIGYDGLSEVSGTVNVSGGGGTTIFSDPVHITEDADSVFASILSGYPQFNAAQAFGSEKKHWWGSNNNSQHWLKVTYAEATVINKVAFSNYWNVGSSTWQSKNVTFQGSNDGTTWTDLLTLTGLAASETQVEYSVANTTAYLYYRFVCASTASYYTGLGKLRLFGVTSGGGGGGTTILSGTTAPTSGVGSDGDLYLKYGLPAEYDELDYIQGTGTQWLQIPHKPSTVDSIEIKLNPQIVSEAAVLGSAWAMKGFFLMTYQNKFRWHSASSADSSVISTNTDYVVKVTNTSMTVNGTSYSVSPCSDPDPTGYPIRIFTTYSGSGNKGRFKVYYVKLFQDGGLCNWLVPAKRKSDDVVGMYDVCTDTFLTNGGTGTFQYGQVVQGEATYWQYAKVSGAWQNLIGTDIDDVNTGEGTPQDDPFALTDYIESSGTQYVDTGYAPTQTSRYEIVANVPTTNSAWATLFGARDSRNTDYGNAVWLGAKTNNANSLTYNWGFRNATLSQSHYFGVKTVFRLQNNSVCLQPEGYLPTGAPFTAGATLTSATLYLFSLNVSAGDYGAETRGSMKLYRFRIYEGDTLVHEFIPWVDGNNVVCLKDTITNTLKYNLGTGSFTYGTDA